MSVLQSLFEHKAWINDQTFTQVGKLDPVAQKDERHLAIRILNHVYVVDRIFAAHITGAPHKYTPPPTRRRRRRWTSCARPSPNPIAGTWSTRAA